MMPKAPTIEALAEAWWQRCQARRCASGRADADERELLLRALGAAAGGPSRLFGRAGPPDGDPGSTKDTSPDAPGPDNVALPPDATSPAVPIERRRTLAAAATRWGARVGSPVLVVEQLVQLRGLIAVEAGQRAITRLIDLTMINACRGATDELQRAAFSDPLTGCSNRRAFERDLDRELARCARAELDLSVVAIDLDGLKAVNDTEGHAAGDRRLVLLVDTLRKALRSMDGIYRLGGDEFGLVLPDTSPEDASVLIARALRLGAPSFSWGTASYLSTGCAAVAELLAVADADLYARRRVMRASPARRRSRPKPADTALRLFPEEQVVPPQSLQAH
ncbi:MAG: GGDEF domain-containing protein [Acidimicrobiales bacterium]|jgi:diguanylate cyclase (GGDEF)-like protein